MINALTVSALAGNFYYHHQELLKSILRLKNGEKRPILKEENDFELPKNWENNIKDQLNSIIKAHNEKSPVKITDYKTYKGEYKNIKGDKIPSGKGILETVKDGRKYIGTFQNGELTGEGGIMDPSGSRIIGTFKNGSLDGLGEMLNDFGKTYKGNFKEGTPAGKGKWIFQDGSFCITDTQDEENIIAECYEKNRELYYKGDYKNYSYTGKGLFYFENGESYEGDMIEGKVEGYGIRRDKYGDELYRGNFVNNQFIGKLQNREVAGYIAIGVVNILLSMILKK